ncbi:MAG: hypothetical protein JXD19_09505, partial [Deltaproteobacteria bacterium]|nr:hypothetical protein [Deltaproteobacteria bacterium]
PLVFDTIRLCPPLRTSASFTSPLAHSFLIVRSITRLVWKVLSLNNVPFVDLDSLIGKIAGWVGIFCGSSAAIAQVLNAVYKKTVLPL